MAEDVTAPVIPLKQFMDDAPAPAMLRRRGAIRIRSHHATIAGSRAHWLAAGSGDPVVLVHGLGNSALVWRRVIPRLAERYRVIAPDLPGFGHSAPIRTHRLLEHYSSFVTDLIRHVSPRRPAAIVGNSVGGAVALRVALTQPDVVSRLVLVDPAGVGQGVPSWWRLVRYEGLVRLASAVPLTLAPHWLIERVVGEAYRHMAFADPSNPSERTVRLFAERLNSRGRIHRFLRSAYDVVTAFERDVQSLERPLPVPLLAVWGREDRLVPLHDALALLERIGGLELRIVEGCGHSPQLEAPDAFLDAVEDFLEGRSSPVRRRRHTTVRALPDRRGGRAAPAQREVRVRQSRSSA